MSSVSAVRAPMPATVVSVAVAAGDAVAPGAVFVILESMKMEHLVTAQSSVRVTSVATTAGATVAEGDLLLEVEVLDGTLSAMTATDAGATVDDAPRPDLAEVLERRARTLDAARPDAVAKHHARGNRTARENLADLLDHDSFVEYGRFAIAAQRRRRDIDELITRTPADGLVGGIGRVAGQSIAAISYDYTVLAGTQGQTNHHKKDRLFEVVEQLRLPVVLFADGGGGRPGDTDTATVSGLDCRAFAWFAGLSGLVPSIGVAAGPCFAGNAALLGCCDVIVATERANIGMGGPAMIEGGGLGTVAPTDIGPIDVQAKNGVVDVRVADEAEAVDVVKQFLSYFADVHAEWTCVDQTRLRGLIPEERRRVYDVRVVIETLADSGSVLELRREFGLGMITAFARVEGRPLGIIANNPVHLGGAIDRDGADKAARFMQLCDAHDVPLLFLCDTPGFMVGPEAEAQAQVRHFSRMFVIGASLTVPCMTLVLRKGYGLGAQAMARGGFREPLWVVAWPTGEFGGMGLEGAVRLGYRRELDAIDDPAQRADTEAKLVAAAYEHGKALNVASIFEIDDVIDPAESRALIVNTLRAVPATPARTTKKRPFVDPW